MKRKRPRLLQAVVPAVTVATEGCPAVKQADVPAEVAACQRRFEAAYEAWFVSLPEESDECFAELLRIGYELKAAKAATGGNDQAQRRGGENHE